MRTAVKLVTLMGNTLVPMAARIQATQPANLIAYWKLGETSGTAADDSSATGADGAYAGTYTLGQPGIGDGSLSTLFAGGWVSLAANLGTLDTPFDPTQGTVFCWAKVTNAGTWTNGASRFMIELGADANNRIFLYKNTPNNTLTGQYNAGGTVNAVAPTTSTLGWFSFAVTWDKNADEVKCYLNGIQNGVTVTGLGVWAGALDSGLSAVADFSSAGSVFAWEGYLAHIAIWNVALTATEVAGIGIL